MSLLPSGVVQSPGIPYFASAGANTITQVPGGIGLGTLNSHNLGVSTNVAYPFKGGSVYYAQVLINIGKSGVAINTDETIASIYPENEDASVLTVTQLVGAYSSGSNITFVLSGYLNPQADQNNLVIDVGAYNFAADNDYPVSIPDGTTIFIQQVA